MTVAAGRVGRAGRHGPADAGAGGGRDRARGDQEGAGDPGAALQLPAAAVALAAFHLAPTSLDEENLILEGVRPARVFVTGNTAINALLWASAAARSSGQPRSVGLHHASYLLTHVTHLATWRALWRIVRGRRDWAKTRRAARAAEGQ